MATTTYTLKQVASVLVPSGKPDEVRRVARQLRHWTALDLLKPVGTKRTGTGTSRRYVAQEVRKAALFLELSLYRIPAPVIEGSYDDSIHDWAEDRLWALAISGEKTVYFYVAYNENLITSQIALADSARTILQAKPDDPNFDFSSAIVINLTKLFGKLRL